MVFSLLVPSGPQQILADIQRRFNLAAARKYGRKPMKFPLGYSIFRRKTLV
jgi:hypothetical protein